MKPISIQLYSLREEAEKDFIAVLESVAAMGYKGVEPAGLFGREPAEVRRVVEDLGMVVSSNHGPWPSRDNLAEVVDVAGALGTDLVVCGFGPEDFRDPDAVRRTAYTANFMCEKIRAAGLQLAVHNHHWEFCPLPDGRLPYGLFLELCPELLCEIDTYWAANFGALDPAKIVARHKARTPLLHIKDGPLVPDRKHLAVGSGKMDIHGVVAAADPEVLRWIVVELDDCDTDTSQAVAQSYAYLTGEGLAEGNK